MPDTILILSKLQRHVTIGANHTQVTSSMSAAESAAEMARAHGVVILVPGANEVNASDWSKVEKYPTLAPYIKSGEIVPQKAANLLQLKQDPAIAMVKECFSLALLDKWEKAENRKPVLQAIADQKKSIADQIAKAEAETADRRASAN